MAQVHPPSAERSLSRAAAWLGQARRPVALTGADLPPGPGPEPPRLPMPPGDYRLDELESPEGFARWPRAAWTHALIQRNRAAFARPGPAHRALVELEGRLGSLPVVTEAVDGLQVRAGSQDVVELHGSALRFRCSRDETHALPSPGGAGGEGPPPCPTCGAPARPGVVWLDEPIPERTIRRAFDLVGECDLLLVAGTRGLYHPAGDLPFVAREVGAKVVLVAPAPTPLDADCDLRIQGLPQAVLPALAAVARTRPTPAPS